MTVPQNARAYTVATGTSQINVPVFISREPSQHDIHYPQGQSWIDPVTNIEYVLTSFSSAGGVIIANWETSGGGAALVSTLTGDSGGAVGPTTGNIDILGTADQITSVGNPGASTITLSLIGPYTPATYTAHGVLVGEGTSSIVATTPGTTGQVLIGATGADPAFGALGVNSGLTAHGVLLGEGNSAIAATAVGTNGQVLLGSTGADPAFGTLTTSTGVAFTTGAHTLAVNVKSNGYAVNSEAGAGPIAMTAQNIYFANDAAKTTFTLPSTAAVGDPFVIVGGSANTGGWEVTYNSGQTIYSNGTASTTSSGNATGAADAAVTCTLVCSVANTSFVILSAVGTITLN